METLLVALILVASVGVLQVQLDRRARRAPKEDRVYLHLEKAPSGPVICDQDGRRLGKLRHMRYDAKLDHVDTILVEVLAYDGDAYYIAGRRHGSKPQ